MGVILAAYRDFEDRVGRIDHAKGAKNRRIKEAINHFVGEFTIADIRRVCPDASRPTIYRTLQEMKDAGDISPISLGRHAKWKKEK